ncbi:MAG TPA: hypothetical protein DCQ64_01485 [Candidatus Rokubacteria bacterium]|nr:hypothetical protein [Candidatus Rokubacteria bacterium]
MSVETIRRCDQCSAEIPNTARRFTMTAHLNETNGDMRQAAQEDRDLCSEKCVVDSVRRLLDDLAPVGRVA